MLSLKQRFDLVVCLIDVTHAANFFFAFPPSFRAVSANVRVRGLLVAQAGIIGRQLLIRVSRSCSLNFEELDNGVVCNSFLSRSGSDCEARAAVLYVVCCWE